MTKERALSLTEMVRRLIGIDMALMNSCNEPSYYDPLFEEKAEILMQMAQRIEALEERLDANERAKGYAHFVDDQG